ncbi:ECF transporter S component [Gulosibacter sp. GYB002]|uniref:ECF transporter S component n=1 Tax=Gulosibacter sp. GYB002 TaxID=2994391 RepID=UPI002F967241
MMVASLSVVGLIILIPLNYIAPAGAASQSAVWLGVSLLGLWVIPYLLPLAVVRRPGASLLAALIIGVVSAFTTPTGPAAIVGNVIGGLLVEFPMALMLYRKWTWWAYLISAAFFGAFNSLLYLTLLKHAVGISVSGLIVLAGVTSSVIGGLAVVGLTRLLNNAGVGVGVDHRE